MANRTRLICFDCDSTLSALEGIDELARLRGPDALRAVESMTRDAMDGKIPLEQVFARRLEIILPTRAELAEVGRLYLQTVEPTARETIAELKHRGWTPVILSAGYTQAIEPLAHYLGISRIEAVALFFDEAGNYRGFDEQAPPTRVGGKPISLAKLKQELHPEKTVMVGDGVSDLETKPVVDLFVGFGRYVARAKVQAGAERFIHSFAELPYLLS